MRVNARFEGVAEQQVEYLAASSGRTVSEVLRESVDFYYRHVRGEGSQLKHLSGLIGQGDSGRSDVSAKVKQGLAEGLDAKYPTQSKVGRTKDGR
ncbi:hypothetical protein PEC18_07110 [Paucibacter sp. O1-1]|nr:hypothetical protein [Paucibacter sp. O1-1]MDA3825641.1 hypothetical protein [Paucibacter sp. O1-1]